MEIVYATEKIKVQCTSLKEAKKLFGGNVELAKSLMARMNALKSADTIKDIVVLKPFHFHKLVNKNGKNYEGYFAIDVKTRIQQWRIILQPLDAAKKPFDPCNIDEIADTVKVVEIVEVSKHYE